MEAARVPPLSSGDRRLASACECAPRRIQVCRKHYRKLKRERDWEAARGVGTVDAFAPGHLLEERVDALPVRH